AADDLENVRVYPSPYRPNDGDTDTGKPYSSSDATSGIIFDRVTEEVTVRIYDLTGKLVRKLRDTATGGVLRWDALNGEGKEVSSGAYFAVIKAPGKDTVTKKFSILR
ncbi:MAG: T9SS type A sorting domain-containing protein, partial [Elusimicrobiota bacterium]|nr:T9SS type A sorting domain-containing protein [Elusimicrobiota bacterium]